MPTASSAVYTGPISVSGTETIKAVAVAAGFTQSGLAAATYTNVPTAVAPVLTPQGGDYPSAIYVSMSDGTAKAKIHYTLDGTEPTTASPTYSSPILVTSNETVKAIASVRGYANSLKSTAAYNISIPNRVIETIAGDGTSGYRGDGGLAVHARLSFPTAVAVDKAGNLYIADNGNNVIRKISADSGKISTVAGNGNPGFQGDGTAATKAELSFPVGVAVDEEGDLYIADLNNQRIRKVTASTGLISTVAGNGYYGNGNGATDGVLAENYSLSNASGVAADNSGDFYIANTDSNQVLGVASTGILNAFAGNVNGSTPESGLSALNVDLYNPAGVSFDGSDDIYITDSNGNLVTKVSIGTGILTLVAGTARQGYSGDGGLATDALLDSPENVSIDKDGNVYIADAYNNVIREVFAASGIITTVAGNGHGAGLGGAVGGYSGDGGPAASAELYLPTGVAVDAEGNMYIADSANNAIRKVTVTGSSAKKYSSEH
jgi:sugar lactone lactonase YvrE